MTPTEQDKELREAIISIVEAEYKTPNYIPAVERIDHIMQLITADRKRVALEAKIEVCDKYLGYRAASSTEAEAIQWLDFQRDELHAELKAQQEKV